MSEADDIIAEFENFDPNHEPQDQDEANRYVQWCAIALQGLISGTEHANYADGRMAAGVLWVAAAAPLHLDEACSEESQPNLLRNLSRLSEHGRMYERGVPVDPHSLTVARGVLGLLEPVGARSALLLNAARCAVAATILIAAQPMEDIWTLAAPDVWALCVMGDAYLNEIAEAEGELTAEDFAVGFSQVTIDKLNWQRARNIADSAGAPPPSPN